jgi:hypothetical protein
VTTRGSVALVSTYFPRSNSSMVTTSRSRRYGGAWPHSIVITRLVNGRGQPGPRAIHMFTAVHIVKM